MVNMCSSRNDVRGACSEKVCRNLFGAVDHEQLKIDAEQMMHSCLEEAKEKWNFDFVHDSPLEGDFKWEKVDVGEECQLPLVCVQPRDLGSTQNESEKVNSGNKTAEGSAHISSTRDSMCAAPQEPSTASSPQDTAEPAAALPPDAAEPAATSPQDIAEPAATSTTSRTCHKRKQMAITDFYQSKRHTGQSYSKPSP